MSIEEITKFEEIYEKYWKLAYSIALKVLRNEVDAEDVVQQTFLYLFCHLEKVGDVDSPSTKAYIAKTAEHILFNLILERTQIFGSAATLATLEVGKAMLPHMLKQFILQDAV